MIEYLYDAIRAHAGNDITITAIATDNNGEDITENVSLVLHDKDRKTMIAEFEGKHVDGEWLFFIPAEITEGLNGRYWYCVTHKGSALCFKQPIYLV